VPAIIVSPWVEPGSVYNEEYRHRPVNTRPQGRLRQRRVARSDAKWGWCYAAGSMITV